MSDATTPSEPLHRVCPRCSVQSTVGGHYCPNCGASFDRRRSSRLSRRTVALGAAALLVIAAVGTGILVKNSSDTKTEARAEAALAEEAAVAEEQEAARLEAAQRASDASERTQRGEVVVQLEDNITKDAKELVDDDLLEGPIKSSSCTATGGGSTDDLTALTGTFECIAVNKEGDDGTASGYAYNGTIDWQSGELTWQLGG